MTYPLTFTRVNTITNPGISVKNTANKLANDKYKWTIFIQAPEAILNNVKCVEYTLDPSFPNPIQTIMTRGTSDKAFPLSATGWGAFTVYIKVIFNDGSVQSLSHYLEF